MQHLLMTANFTYRLDCKMTKAEMMKRLYDERKEKGMVQFKMWVTTEQLEKLKEFCKTL